jgi:hypothetical protein
MTVHVLVTGTLLRAAESRTASSGRRYVKATLRAAAADNTSADFWDLICFSETAGAELQRLDENERIAVQGSLKLELYAPEGKPAKIQRTVFVDSTLALRAPPKTKNAKPPASGGENTQPAKVNIVPPAATPSDLNDDIPL